MRGEVRSHIEAAPLTVYALVSDVTRMGEWSPETQRANWIGGATGPEPGARFRGTNRRGLLRWSNKPRVDVADPGREFTFTTSLLGRDLTTWRYRFEPSGDGTDVIESFDARDTIIVKLMGGDRRREELEAGMRTTLERLKDVAERT